MDGRRNRNSTARAGLWSTSKCTNRKRFAPYHAEAERGWLLSRQGHRKATCIVTVGTEAIKVFRKSVHADFRLPISEEDVAGALRRLPGEYLRGLEAVYLLGGSSSQMIRRQTWGMYGWFAIYLCPMPRRSLAARGKGQPCDNDLRRLWPFRPLVRRCGDECAAEVRDEELREFYLRDILIHEIGHHVDFLKRGLAPSHRVKRSALLRLSSNGSENGSCSGDCHQPPKCVGEGVLERDYERVHALAPLRVSVPPW